MAGKIVLKAGVPDEANRDYLPEIIKTTQIVVNENGNNSQPYPEKLVEMTGALLPDGLEDYWYEYVPETYDPSKPTPLVVSCHGGLMTGWGQCIYTSWTMVAEREGFICMFPSANINRFWQTTRRGPMPAGFPRKIGGVEIPPSPPTDAENHDIQNLMAIIADMKKRYNIDESRIYIQGMSAGGGMTNQMVGYTPLTFAAYATSGAPGAPNGCMSPEGEVLREMPPVPHFLSMPEHNGWNKDPERSRDQKDTIRNTLNYWKKMNGVESLPIIKVEGEDNYAFYTGTKANLVLRDIRNRDHGQTLDDAELVWSYLFSGSQRNADGTITSTPTSLPWDGDKVSIMIFDGLDKAFVDQKPVKLEGAVNLYHKLKYHGLDGGEFARGEYFCAPVSFIADTFGAELTLSDEGKVAELKMADGREIQFALGSIGCVIDNHIYSMDCEARMVNGVLNVPVEWFCHRVMNYTTSRRENALYITDHYTELSTYLAMVIEDILKDWEA